MRKKGKAGVGSRRFAALVDVENTLIVGGSRMQPAAASLVLHTVASRLQGMQVRVATGRGILLAYTSELACMPWGLTLVGRGADAADEALIQAGDGFVSMGVTDLVVVSGDHAFAELASRADLHVLARRDHLSRALRFAARTVTYLPDEAVGRCVTHTLEVA